MPHAAPWVTTFLTSGVPKRFDEVRGCRDDRVLETSQRLESAITGNQRVGTTVAQEGEQEAILLILESRERLDQDDVERERAKVLQQRSARTVVHVPCDSRTLQHLFDLSQEFVAHQHVETAFAPCRPGRRDAASLNQHQADEQVGVQYDAHAPGLAADLARRLVDERLQIIGRGGPPKALP